MSSPSKMLPPNHVVTGVLSSSAIRKLCPDLSAIDDLEMEKLSSEAACNTLFRVFSETSSGRVKARETVDAETFARIATS